MRMGLRSCPAYPSVSPEARCILGVVVARGTREAAARNPGKGGRDINTFQRERLTGTNPLASSLKDQPLTWGKLRQQLH